jgi:hypothetical protein
MFWLFPCAWLDLLFKHLHVNSWRNGFYLSVCHSFVASWKHSEHIFASKFVQATSNGWNDIIVAEHPVNEPCNGEYNYTMSSMSVPRLLLNCMQPISVIGRLGDAETVTSQNVGQFRGRIEGLLCIASEITGFFTLLFLKPKSDRISLRGELVNSRSAKGWAWSLSIHCGEEWWFRLLKP